MCKATVVILYIGHSSMFLKNKIKKKKLPCIFFFCLKFFISRDLFLNSSGFELKKHDFSKVRYPTPGGLSCFKMLFYVTKTPPSNTRMTGTIGYSGMLNCTARRASWLAVNRKVTANMLLWPGSGRCKSRENKTKFLKN